MRYDLLALSLQEGDTVIFTKLYGGYLTIGKEYMVVNTPKDRRSSITFASANGRTSERVTMLRHFEFAIVGSYSVISP